MFCSKCGMQLPEDARFCNHCGSPVAQQMNYRQPQYYTAPYTLPLDASPEAKAQYPNYTVPLDGAAARPYPQYTAPVDPAQQSPQYIHQPDLCTTPVFGAAQQQAPASPPKPQLHETNPVESKPQKIVEPIGRYPSPPASAGKNRKPVMLGTIAVVLAAVLLVLFSGGDKKPEKEAADIVTTEPAKPTEPEYRAAPRYSNWHFNFNETQLQELYLEELEANGIPLTEFTKFEGKTVKTAYVKYKGEEVIRFQLFDAGTYAKGHEGKIGSVEAKFCGTGEYTQEEMEMLVKAIALLIHTCHGDMTEELWKQTMENPVLEDVELGSNLMSTYRVDNMYITIEVGEMTMLVKCKAE